jgi:hypothetical protein
MALTIPMNHSGLRHNSASKIRLISAAGGSIQA